MEEVFEVKGLTGTVIVYPNKVVLKYSKFLGSGKGEKEIRSKSITGIQLKKPGLTNGYIQFSFSGSSEQKGRSAFDAAKDENTIMISNNSQYQDMEKVKRLIESYQDRPEIQIVHSTPDLSVADEIKKFADLRDAGILTTTEFEAKKKQLLGL
jgi:hypothetical protein